MSIQLRYHVTLKDFLAAHEVHWKKEKVGTHQALWLGISGLIATPFIYLWLNETLGILLAAACFVHLLMPVLRRFRSRWMFNQSKKFNSPFVVTYAEKDIRFQADGIDSVLAWNIYSSCVEGDAEFLLYMSRTEFTIVPKFAFASDEEMDAFKQMISGKMPVAVM